MNYYKNKKVYGEYRTDQCAFCGKQAIFTNKVKLAVCKTHKDTEYPTYKCACGAYVDVLRGKFGNYCQCPKCGNVNLKTILEFNGIKEE